jgi:hypothetical protein
MLLFFRNRSAMVSKHSKLTKRQAQNYYGWFASPSSRTAPPPSGMRWEAPAAVTPLLLPRATRWQTPATIAPLLLPHVCRRWDAQPSPHRSSSLVPGGGFIRRLSGDVGGGSSSSTPAGGSSDTPNGSSSDISWGVVLRLPLGLLGLQRWVPPC